MKIDRLLALIRLANNNPNEHEANRAARKVCELLDETKKPEFEVVVKSPFGYRPSKAQQDFHKGGPRTWNDVKRSTEPQWRSDPATGPGTPFNDFFNEFFRGGRRSARQYGQKINEEEWARYNNVRKKAAPTPEEEARYKEKYQKHASNYSYKPPFDPSDTETWVGQEYKVHIDPDKMPKYDADGKRIKKPEKIRQCIKCGFEVSTRREDEPFVCTVCLWQEEELKKKGAK